MKAIFTKEAQLKLWVPKEWIILEFIISYHWHRSVKISLYELDANEVSIDDYDLYYLENKEEILKLFNIK